MKKIFVILMMSFLCIFINIRDSYADENVILETDVNYDSSKGFDNQSGEDKLNKPDTTKITKVNRKYATLVKIRWKKLKNVDGYCIYRSSKKNEGYKRVATTMDNFYNDKVKAKQRYYYKVRAFVKVENKKIYGDYSEAFKVGLTVKKKVKKLNVVDINEKLYTYLEMENDLHILKKKYPNYFTYKVAGKSYDGRNIYIICLGNKNAKKEILIQSTIHGREYMNSAICMAQLEYYLNNWNAMYDDKNTYGDLFNNTCVYIMPMLNPDGVTISQFGYKRIKNSRLREALKEMSGISNYERWKANARGVDINRNFSSFWIRSGEAGAAFYSGAKPDSERETRVIKKIINKHNFQFILSYHSMGNRVYWNVGQKGRIYNKSYILARKISKLTGYPLGEESVPEGLSYNWSIYEKKIPEIIIENGVGICPLSVSEYKKTWRIIKDLIPEMIR